MDLIEFLMIAKSAILSALIGMIVVSIFYIIYFFYCNKKGIKNNISIQNFILKLVFIGYIIIVIFATLLNRSASSSTMHANFQLFSFYRKAINSANVYDWNIIFLNIMMFIPLGILLPCCFRRIRSWWKVYLLGFFGTCVIESIQLITCRGYFELDDIFNNTWGCMLGYGIVTLGYSIYQKVKINKQPDYKVLLYQLPLIVMILSFFCIYVAYCRQELGNLSQSFYQTVDMSNIDIQCLPQLCNQDSKQYVYKIIDYTDKQCYQLATTLFEQQQLEIEQNFISKHNEMISYSSLDNKMTVVINQCGGEMMISFSQKSSPKSGLSLDKVKKILCKAGISLYQVVAFEELDNGQYKLIVDDKKMGVYYSGSMICNISSNDQLISVNYSVKAYQEYKMYSVISSDQAYEMIKDGKFNTNWLNEFKQKMIIEEVEMDYIEDSKGFYQPVYLFWLDDGGVIIIPALNCDA